MSNEGTRRRTQATSASEGSSSNGIRHRSNRGNKEEPSQQQRMLRQMKAQRELEQQQAEVVEAVTGNALSDQMLKLGRTLLIVLVVGAGILYYVSPGLVKKWLKQKPQLPTRSLISVYPDYVDIRRDLPRFFHEYSLATPENLPTRQAIRHVASLRKMATNPGSKYAQKIFLWPWEMNRFRNQLPNVDAIDPYCGKGTDALYRHRPELRQEIVLWCLLKSGHDHGFVQFDVQQVYGSIARGVKGVAVRYDGYPNRAMINSIFLVPFHSPEALKKGKELPPSTQVTTRTMSWLRQNAPLINDKDELRVAMEEFLYFAISQEEEDKWHWMQAACTREERQARDGEPRVASMCTAEQEADGADCCVIFDPNFRSFYGRAKARVATDKEDEEEEEADS